MVLSIHWLDLRGSGHRRVWGDDVTHEIVKITSNEGPNTLAAVWLECSCGFKMHAPVDFDDDEPGVQAWLDHVEFNRRQ